MKQFSELLASEVASGVSPERPGTDWIYEPNKLPVVEDVLRSFLQPEGLRKHVTTELRDVGNLMTVALSPETRTRRTRNRAIASEPDYLGTDALESVAAATGALIADVAIGVSPESVANHDYFGQASLAILQSAYTTVSAIGVLLAAGYTGDGYARWRGLHELACSAIILAESKNPLESAKRFLCHGGLLPAGHPAYAEVERLDPKFAKDYAWVRGDPDHAGEPQIRQWWIFDRASPQTCNFQPWISEPREGSSVE